MLQSQKSLHREFFVFDGKVSNFYGQVCQEAVQTKDGQIRQVFVQITDDVKTNPNWKESLISQVRHAQEYLDNKVEIYVVGSDGMPALQ